MSEAPDTETLAEVLCPECPHGIKWHHDERGCQYHGNGPHACPCGLSIDAGIAARIEQARAGEGALRERMEALADAWQADLDTGGIRDKDARYCWQMAVSELRAALAETDQP